MHIKRGNRFRKFSKFKSFTRKLLFQPNARGHLRFKPLNLSSGKLTLTISASYMVTTPEMHSNGILLSRRISIHPCRTCPSLASWPFSQWRPSATVSSSLRTKRQRSNLNFDPILLQILFIVSPLIDEKKKS